MLHQQFQGKIRFGKLATGLLIVLGTSSFSSVQAAPSQASFDLYPNTQFIPCLAANPYVKPTVNVVVKRGKLNDEMTLTLRNFKPNLKFDLFTVQRSNQLANGQPVPNFPGFGLAWYQSDIEPGTVTIKTILLDQIFGFNPDVNLKPTNTFHVGFWFNDPKDAKACGFDVTKPTPFNGEHKAGPLAFISRPNSATNLGPLCTNPNTSTNPATCKP